MGYGASERLFGKIVFIVPIILMPFALLIFAFSSCNVRKRSDKRECRAGDAKACLELGAYYEAKAPGIIGFLMSYNDDALTYLDYGCKAKNVEACEKMYTVFAHGADQAKNGSVSVTDIADELIGACAAGGLTLCDDLWEMMDQGDWVEQRAATGFEKACNGGKPMACFKLAIMHQHKLAGLKNIIEQVLPLLEKACAAKVYDSCAAVKTYQARDAQLDAEKAKGSGSGTEVHGAGSAHTP